MQYDKARELRERWQSKGNPKCSHPELDKEYYLGAQTGDYVCTTCGKNFMPDEYEDFRK